MSIREDVAAALTQEGRDHLRLRIGLVCASIAAAIVTSAASGAARPTGVGVLFTLALLAALVPDGHVPTILIAGHLVFWFMTVPRPASAAAIAPAVVTAILLLAVHLLSAAATVWPPGGRIPRSAARRWLRQGGAVALATIAVGGLTALLVAAPLPAGTLVSLAAVAALGAGAIAAYRLIAR